MKCKKCGKLLAKRNYEKCLCDNCQNKTANFQFIRGYVIKGALALLLCSFDITIFHIIPWEKSVIVIIRIIQIIIPLITGTICALSLANASHYVHSGEKTRFQAFGKSFLIVFACVSICILFNLLMQFLGLYS